MLRLNSNGRIHKIRFAEVLKYIKSEVIAGMKTSLLREKIDPLPVKCRHTHLRRITMIQVRPALIERRRMKIVRIIHIRIVIKPLPLLGIGCAPMLPC